MYKIRSFWHSDLIKNSSKVYSMTVTLLSDNRNSIIAKQSKYRQMNFWIIFYIDIIIIFHINIMHKDYNFLSHV